MHAIIRLQELGYRVDLKGSKIKLIWQREDDPDPTQVCPLLEEIRIHREQAIQYLKQSASCSIHKPGECESCRAGGYWPGHGDGLWCFFHSYFFGKCAPAQKVTKELRENCSLRKYGQQARKIWTN